MDNDIREQFAVVALFDMVEVGKRVPRSEFPPHLTLASTFVVEAAAERVAQSVRDGLKGLGSIEVRFIGAAMFGPSGNFPVQIVEPAPVLPLHQRLVDALEQLPGFAADEPNYWREGYGPHVTRSSADNIHEGDAWLTRCVATVRLTKEHATFVDVLKPGNQ